MKYVVNIFLSFTLVILINCTPEDPNKSMDGVDIMEKNASYDSILYSGQYYRDTTYISAYSEIYSKTKLTNIPLTVMLSIRSGSFTDTTIINAITYYDTEGTIVKEYISRPILLKPMQSIDYIVALPRNAKSEPKNRGGIGAHFIVDWGAKYNTQPIMQCVMHGAHGSNAISFMVPGKSIATRNVK
jgi:hypothetical protein